MASLALLNGPEDIRDAMSAYKQIKALCTGKQYEKPYDYKIAQHPFSFFRGTLLNDYVNPFSKKCKFPMLANKLLSWDKTLWDTEVGDWLSKKFNIETTKIPTEEKSIYYTKANPQKLTANIYNSPSKLGNLTARAMTRTPVLGLAFSGAMETAHLVKENNDGHNPFIEIGKSTLRLAGSAIITGYCGAIGSKFGPVGSIISMGIGSVLNNKIEHLIAEVHF